MRFREITAADDASLAELIRMSLKEHGLDIPGTVYFDEGVDHLSDFYLADPAHRAYLVLEADDGTLAGGVGLDAFPAIPGAAELQKLYLSAAHKGKGLGYELMAAVEEKARELGYERMYLETHSNLPVAIHLYERCGYQAIDRPASVQHATMDRFLLKEL